MRTRPSVLVALAFAMLGSVESAAQCPPAQWSGMALPGGLGATAIYATFRWDPDGGGPASPLLVAGGDITMASGALASRVAAWNGSTWVPMGANLVGGRVWSFAEYQGSLYAGGNQTSLSTATSPNIGRWGGTAWQPVGSGLNGNVRALAVFGGELIAGGDFTTAGGVAAPYLARWNGTAWAAFGPPVNGEVDALRVANGELVAGGNFTTAGGLTVNRIARWNGVSWQPYGVGLGATVYALAEFGGQLVAAGQFNSSGSASIGTVARWDGTSWLQLGAGVWSAVRSLEVLGSELVAGGDFVAAGGVSAGHIAAWDGSWAWRSLGLGLSATVRALIVDGGTLVAAGDFDAAGTVGLNRIARWSGTTWSALTPEGFNGTIASFSEFQGDLVVGGGFTIAGGPSARRVARRIGTGWQPLGEGMTGSGQVFVPPPAVTSLTIHGGDLIAGGNFEFADSNPALNVAAWNGTSWRALGGGVGAGIIPAIPVNAVTTYLGEVIAAGQFTAASGVPASNIAAWNGTSWRALGSGLNGPVRSMRVVGGLLVVGGNFSAAGGLSCRGIATWDGASWQPFGYWTACSTETSVAVYAVGEYQGNVVAGHVFSCGPFGPTQFWTVLRWTGSAWVPLGGAFTNFVGAAWLTTIEEFGGDLVVAGDFTSAGGVAVERIAAWNGTSWRALGTGLDGTAGRLHAWRDQLLVAGTFRMAGGITSPYFAQWSVARPYLRLLPSTASSSVTVIDEDLIAGHEYFNLYSTELCGGGVGTGPWIGLCATDLTSLLDQIALPIGAQPFHFVAVGPEIGFGPYAVPPGFAFDGVCIDVTPAVFGCHSGVQRFLAP